MKEYTRSEMLNELSKLYVLQREGKKVKALIRELELELWEKCDEELDARIDNKQKVESTRKIKKMNKPAYKRGPYKKHNKEDAMTSVSTEKAMESIYDLVKKGAVEKSPLLRIPKYNIKQGLGDEEEMVLLFSDLQVGHKSPSTNLEVLKKRMETLVNGVVKIVSLQRQAIPIKKLHVFALGDMIQSEDIMSKVDLDSLEMVLMDQIFNGAVPLTEKMLLSLLPLFPDGIDVWCVTR
jgi:hypothetical protein